MRCDIAWGVADFNNPADPFQSCLLNSTIANREDNLLAFIISKINEKWKLYMDTSQEKADVIFFTYINDHKCNPTFV